MPANMGRRLLPSFTFAGVQQEIPGQNRSRGSKRKSRIAQFASGFSTIRLYCSRLTRQGPDGVVERFFEFVVLGQWLRIGFLQLLHDGGGFGVHAELFGDRRGERELRQVRRQLPREFGTPLQDDPVWASWRSSWLRRIESELYR